MDSDLAAVRPQRDVDAHVFRAGVLAGVLAFVAFVGVFRDVYALVNPYPAAWANEEWKYLEVSTPLELITAALLWRCRDVFAR